MSDKNTVLERLSRRDAQRLDKIHKAHKAREDDDVSNETEDYFAGAFKIKSEYIEDLLSLVPTLELKAFPSHFDNIKKEINELQKYVVTSSLFLKEFNMRKHLGLVQKLQSKCYELEDIYLPRKKFGFSKKKIPRIDVDKNQAVDKYDGTLPGGNKWDEKLFGFDTQENKILSIDSKELFQRDVTLRNLKNCTLSLKGVMGTLHMTDLVNCIILSGPVTSSVFMDNCSNCRVIVACQQLRMHTSSKCDIYLHVTSKGIIEDCNDIKVAPYNLSYDDLESHYLISGLDRNINNWDALDDFNWLSPDSPSPNWSIMGLNQRIINWNEWWSKTLL